MLLNGKTAKITFVPRGNNVLLERLVGGELSEGGIAIPPRYVENPLMAKVLDVGPGKEIPYLSRRPTTKNDPAGAYLEEGPRFEHVHGLEVGDIVFFNIKQAIPCERDANSRLCIVDADHILAVVKHGD